MLELIDSPDAKLTEQVHEGNGNVRLETFDELVRQHSPRLMLYLAAKGLSSEEQKDVVNEAWSRVWHALDRYEYRAEVGFFPWLRTFADNIVHEFERKHYLAHGTNALDPEFHDPKATNEALVHLTREEIRTTIEGLLPDVPNADWRIVIEAHLADLWQTAEIMVLYDWSRSKADTTKHRALSWLRSRLLEIVGPTDIDAWLGDP